MPASTHCCPLSQGTGDRGQGTGDRGQGTGDREVVTWWTVHPALASAALTAGMGPVPISAGSTPALALATILDILVTASLVSW